MLALAGVAGAQEVGNVLPEGARPGDRPLPVPEFTKPVQPRPVLPPWTPPDRGPSSEGDTATLRIERIAFVGNSALSDEELSAVAEPWLARPLGTSELRALRDALTLAYVREGYRTSGARILTAIDANGTLRVRIVEGQLARVKVDGTSWLRPEYVERRLARASGQPLDVREIESRIRRLQRDPQLESIHANLRPGSRLGESVLDVHVTERNPLEFRVNFDNELSPSLGDFRGQITLTHRNLLGFGDSASVAVDRTKGGGAFEGRYAIPLTRYDTRFEFQTRYSKNDLVLGLGEELEIESDYWGFDLTLHQPFEVSESLEVGIGVTGSLRESEVRFLDRRNFPIPGAEDAPARVAALRAVADALWRGRDHVVALRSTASFGLDAFHSTRNPGSAPESRFTSWLTQIQWVQRYTPLDLELVARADLQLASDRLLTLEQFSLGGRHSVRGYRENQLVRDQGVAGSFELRIPIWRDGVGERVLVQLAPFFDVGRVWNVPRASRSLDPPDMLASAGVGLRVQPTRNFRGEFYWGAPLYDADVDEEGLQDDGIHFRLTASWP